MSKVIGEKKRTVMNNTFVIKILYQRNTSWQGEIKWLEGQENIKFRSVLELINLIQEILNETEDPEVKNGFKHWKKKPESKMCLKK